MIYGQVSFMGIMDYARNIVLDEIKLHHSVSSNLVPFVSFMYLSKSPSLKPMRETKSAFIEAATYSTSENRDVGILRDNQKKSQGQVSLPTYLRCQTSIASDG